MKHIPEGLFGQEMKADNSDDGWVLVKMVRYSLRRLHPLQPSFFFSWQVVLLQMVAFVYIYKALQVCLKRKKEGIHTVLTNYQPR